MSVWDILLLAALACGVFAAIRALRKGGGSCGGCSGDCENCGKRNTKTQRRP